MGRSGCLEHVPVVRVPSGSIHTAQRGSCCYKRVMDMTTFWVGTKRKKYINIVFMVIEHPICSMTITHNISKTPLFLVKAVEKISLYN